MNQKSIREYDSLPDRIKLHRQADKRGILVLEGESDERFINRLAPGRWMLFRAGSRNIVITTIERTVALGVDRAAGLIDQDFDAIVTVLRDRDLPIFWCDNADLEGHLFLTSALKNLVEELASEVKLRAYGGSDAVQKVAIAVALEIAALRRANASHGWGLPFDRIDLSRKIDRETLSLKRQSYCQALADCCDHPVDSRVLHEIAERAGDSRSTTSSDLFFRGKDALVIVGVALKSKIGSCSSDTARSDHLASVLRLSATFTLLDAPPFSDIASCIDAA